MPAAQRLMGTAQDNDLDFKWRPPTGDGVLGKADDYQADDNEVFRVDEELPVSSAAYPMAAAGEPAQHALLCSYCDSIARKETSSLISACVVFIQ